MNWEMLADLAVPAFTGVALGLSIQALRLARRARRERPPLHAARVREQVVEEIAQEFEGESYLDHLSGAYLAELIREHRTAPDRGPQS